MLIELKRDLKRGEFENETVGNLQGRPVSTISRWNDLIHVVSG